MARADLPLADVAAVARALAAIPDRVGGSDAERRAALLLRDAVRAAGGSPRLETHWVRPQAAASLALHAAATAVAGVVAVTAPLTGLALAALAAASLVLEVSGRALVGRRSFFRRATQDVVVPAPPGPAPVTLVLAAHYDAPRRGLAFRPGLRRLGARLQRAARGRLPGPLAWPVLAALAVVAAAAARAAGAEGDALGAAQLVPTVVLLATVALAIDVALAGAAPGASDPGSAAALALALWDDLRAAAPRHLAPELVLAGAGSDEPAGFAAHLGRRGRRRYDGARTIVVALAPCGHGQPRWFAREGVLLARAAHPRLRAAAARAAAAAPAQPHGWRGPGEAQAARRAGLPAITVGCLDPGGWLPAARHPDDTADALDAAALSAARAYARALIAELDREVGAAPPPPPA